MESGGEQVVRRRMLQKVSSQLIDGELIEWQIRVKGTNHPVTPWPYVAGRILLVAVGIGVAGKIQPHGGPSLAKTRRGQQTVDHLFPRCLGIFFPFRKERLELLEFGWKPGEIKSYAAQPFRGRRFR